MIDLITNYTLALLKFGVKLLNKLPLLDPFISVESSRQGSVLNMFKRLNPKWFTRIHFEAK